MVHPACVGSTQLELSVRSPALCLLVMFQQAITVLNHCTQVGHFSLQLFDLQSDCLVGEGIVGLGSEQINSIPAEEIEHAKDQHPAIGNFAFHAVNFEMRTYLCASWRAYSMLLDRTKPTEHQASCIHLLAKCGRTASSPAALRPDFVLPSAAAWL